jgi:hypothetical protein
MEKLAMFCGFLGPKNQEKPSQRQQLEPYISDISYCSIAIHEHISDMCTYVHTYTGANQQASQSKRNTCVSKDLSSGLLVVLLMSQNETDLELQISGNEVAYRCKI